MAAVAKKCYYSNTSKIILFDFYSRSRTRVRIVPTGNRARRPIGTSGSGRDPEPSEEPRASLSNSNRYRYRDWWKKGYWPKIRLMMKSTKFLLNSLDIQAILPFFMSWSFLQSFMIIHSKMWLSKYYCPFLHLSLDIQSPNKLLPIIVPF